MKMIVFLCALLLAASGSVFGQTEFFTPMKGSATPEFQTSNADGDRCLVFGRNVVKTTRNINGGENVEVWHREGTAKGTAACELTAGPYASIEDSDNNEFYGISTSYFFIDQGTSAGSRTLVVYKTGSGDEVTQVDYFGNSVFPRIEAARYLFYDAPSTKKGPISNCKEAAKWKRQGGSVGWVQGKKLDLDTQKSSNVGTLRCVYQE